MQLTVVLREVIGGLSVIRSFLYQTVIIIITFENFPCTIYFLIFFNAARVEDLFCLVYKYQKTGHQRTITYPKYAAPDFNYFNYHLRIINLRLSPHSALFLVYLDLRL